MEFYGCENVDVQGVQFSSGHRTDLRAEFTRDIRVRGTQHGSSGEGSATHYYGPVVTVNGDGAQVGLATGKGKVKQVAPGYEELARALEAMSRHLPQLGLPLDDLTEVWKARDEVLNAVTEPEVDAGLLKRATQWLKGLLTPVVVSAASGVSDAAHDSVQHAVTSLTLPF